MLRVLVLLMIVIGLNFTLLATNVEFEPCAVEICDNGIDDDGDGLIDLNDDDCICNSSLDSLLIPSSLIPNPSFEDTLCCPDNLAQLTCAKNWIQASDATSDYFNTCGFTSDRYRTVPPQPLPSGNGYVGFRDEKNYKEYVGTCLTDVMSFGVPYMLEFYVGFGKDGDFWQSGSPFHLSIYGSEDCVNLPFGGPGYVSCPLGLADWFEIAQVTVKGKDEWVKVSMEFTLPVDVRALVVGPSCEAPKGENFYYLDDLILAESTAFESTIIDVVGSACDKVITLSGQKYRGVKYQWFVDGIAILGANSRVYKIKNFKQGDYQLRMSVMGNCFFSDIYQHHFESYDLALDTSMCSGDVINWEGLQISKGGMFFAAYKKTNGCDSIISLDVELLDVQSTSIDTTLCDGEFIEIGNSVFNLSGNHIVNLKNQFGCDSVVNLNLEMLPNYSMEIDTQLCRGETLGIGIESFDQSGDYMINLYTINGCDSIVNLKLKISESTFSVIDTLMCVNDIIEVAGVEFYSAGQYEVLIANKNGCDSSITVNIKTFPTYHMIVDTTICPSSILNIGNYSYEEAGIYRIEEFSVNGCDSITEVRLNIAQEIDPSIELLHAISCNNDEDASIQINVNGGYGQLNYLWSNEETKSTLVNLAPGNYSVIIKDELGCEKTAAIEVINPTILKAEFISINPTCTNSLGGKIELNFASGGTPPYRLVINGEIMDDSAMKDHEFGPGDYEVALLDKHNCMVTNLISFEEPGLGEIDITANKEIYIQGELVDLNLEMFDINADITSINWYPKSSFKCSNCEDVQTRLFRSKLEVSVEVTDDNGCIYTRSILLKANSEYFVPNVFSPNGDGINDVFTVLTDVEDVNIISFEIFNRWGNKVYAEYDFNISNVDKFWNGTFKGSNVLPSTYVYKILLEDHVGNQNLLSGDITLLR